MLTEEQINRALGQQPVSAVAPATNEFQYDSRIDEVILGMFDRRWDELQEFPQMAIDVFRRIVWTLTLGDDPEDDDLQILWAVLKGTKNPEIRSKVAVGLRSYLADCSGRTSPRFKRDVRADLERLGLFPVAAPTRETQRDEP